MAAPVPTFYPTASRALKPSEEDLKTVQQTEEMLRKIPKFADLFDGKSKVRDQYIRRTCHDLNFHLDVVKDRGAESLTFDLAKKMVLEEVYKSAGVVPTARKRQPEFSGKMNAGPGVKPHANCHATSSSEKHQLKSVEEKQKKDQQREEKKRQDARAELLAKRRRLELAQQSEIARRMREKKAALKWDEYLLTRVSGSTARWLVSRHVDDQSEQEKLRRFLEGRPGIGFQFQEDLITDDSSEVGDPPPPDPSLRPGGIVLKTGTMVTREGTVLTAGDDLDKKIKSVYFKQDLVEEDEEVKRVVGECENSTAAGIHVDSYQPAPLPTYKSTHPALGDKVLDSENQFLQELLLGNNQVHQPAADHQQEDREIVMDNGNVYKVPMTNVFPPRPKGKEAPGVQRGKPSTWSGLPEVKRDGREMVAGRGAELDIFDKHKNNYVPLDKDGVHRKLIVDRWLKANKLGLLWHQSEVLTIVASLESLSDQTRLEAIGVCARAAVYRLEKFTREAISSRSYSTDQTGGKIEMESHGGYLPEAALMELVHLKLQDANELVRIGAAITIFMLGHMEEEAAAAAAAILKRSLEDARYTEEEKLAAALTLTYAGYCDSNIANTFINCMLHTSDQCEFELCQSELTKLSDSTKVVHCLTAELLNSNCWKHRFLACKIFPRLKGQPSKDIIHKLVHLMWNDAQPSVRTSAAISIGKLKLGRHVHEKLLKLLKETDREKLLDAVTKTGDLGIMTERILPHYLKCFRHDYISVRVAACDTAGKLLLRLPEILKALEHCAQFDTSYKVKTAAIRAFGNIGSSSPEVAAGILWALRWVPDNGVLMESARAVVKLNLRGEHVTKVIQERLLALTDETPAVSELKRVLEWLGEDPQGDLEMIRTLKQEIRKRSTKSNIFNMIQRLENEDEDKILHDQLLYNAGDGESQVTSDYASSKAGTDVQSQDETNIEDGKDVDADNVESEGEESEASFTSEDSLMSERELAAEAADDEEHPGSTQQPDSRTSAQSGPPKPTFFKSLTLSRASDQKSRDSNT